MDADVKALVHACAEESGEERISFGEVVGRLTGAGVERYHVDLVRSEATYYLPDGDSERVPAHATRAVPADAFSARGVEAAVREIQGGTIGYRTFRERVMRAGCVGYIASMAGRRVVYYGSTGDSHVEHFPGAR